MKSYASITIALIAIILVSCAPISTPEPIGSTSTNTPEPTATFTPEPTATLTPEPTATFTPEPTATFMPEPTATPQLFNLQVFVFWDLNGNGVADEGEPPLEGIISTVLGQKCISDVNGTCTIIGISTGKQTLSIIADDNFKYITPNVETDFLLSQGYSISILDNSNLSIPLVEGPYRSPFRNFQSLEVRQWKDIDITTCWGVFPDRKCDKRIDWLGGNNTYDGHDGTDFQVGSSGEIYAMRSGTVIEMHPADSKNLREGYAILIEDTIPYGRKGKSYQSFVHLENPNVSIGELVTPNTLLGTGATRGTVHVGIYYNVPTGKHPAGIEFQINPYNKCPFDERLWTSFYALANKIIERNELSGAYKVVFP